jgi:hypothetical protein
MEIGYARLLLVSYQGLYLSKRAAARDLACCMTSGATVVAFDKFDHWQFIGAHMQLTGFIDHIAVNPTAWRVELEPEPE